MVDWKPSKIHFEYLRSRPYVHLASNMSYLIEKHGDVLYVCFQETSGSDKQALADDWAANLDFFPRAFDIFPGSKIKAHEGLAKQYMEVREEIMGYLYSGKYRLICVGGYSQGGGITTGCVQDIGYHIDRDKLNVEVFGVSYNAPRFFGAKNKKLIEKSLNRRLLTVKGHWDPVVHVPLKIMPTFFSFRWKPFKLRICRPHLTIWKDYGDVIWTGKPWKFLPMQHFPNEVGKNLLETFEK